MSAAHAGKGSGRDLVEACVREAQDLGITRVFALTYQKDFFARMGFEVIEKRNCPRKSGETACSAPSFPTVTKLPWQKISPALMSDPNGRAQDGGTDYLYLSYALEGVPDIEICYRSCRGILQGDIDENSRQRGKNSQVVAGMPLRMTLGSEVVVAQLLMPLKAVVSHMAFAPAVMT